MFLITKSINFKFINGLLLINSYGLKQAIFALISVIASTACGVDYLTTIDLEKVIEILKE
jgi:hypothetical protein